MLHKGISLRALRVLRDVYLPRVAKTLGKELGSVTSGSAGGWGGGGEGSGWIGWQGCLLRGVCAAHGGLFACPAGAGGRVLAATLDKEPGCITPG